MTEQANDNFQLEQAIGYNINRTAFLMSEEISRRFGESGYLLTAQDFGILYRLHKQDGLTQIDIARLMMRDKTTVTRRLDGLVGKGLVVRNPSPVDRRFFTISLTADGQAAIQKLVELVSAFQQEVLRDVPAEEKAVTINTLRKIADTITRNKP